MTPKTSLRNEARARRAVLTRADFAGRIAAVAKDLPLAPGAIVAGYYPVRDEADPRALMSALAALGHPIALPVIVAERAALVFRRWRTGDPLAPNAYGIAEPLAGAQEVEPDAVLVPLLAFDAGGHRLGYGGGYYDRTLDRIRKAKPVLAVGIAYAGQEVALLPREAHDHALDMMLTENGLRRFAR
ncbi:MAG TPA: 5-formyltetrahydrofolate cyclo-ligase [Rhizomicrobium sp.]|nr:5-formyltetrahydrofolate cyclo-ligase [Rhizomicrobium sp.]